MASLAEREGLRGKVQCIYFDPPYGIKFNSNFQWSTTSRECQRMARPTTSPVSRSRSRRFAIRGGTVSLLPHLSTRPLTVARDLLTESGSIFLQIGDENVHRVRAVMEEVFGETNFVSQIAFQTTTGRANATLAAASNYLLWFAKNADTLKFRAPLLPKSSGASTEQVYRLIRKPDGDWRRLDTNGGEELQEGERIFRADNITSSRPAGDGDVRFFKHEGRSYPSGKGTFKTDESGLKRLAKADRIWKAKNSIQYVRYLDDFDAIPISNVWTDTQTGNFTEDKVYVVQTAQKVVQRCVLMTTDPGDLVLDPTCGSGTTATVAEQWGRRWITIDTSRVALALARARIMGARYPYYLLADSREGQLKEAEITRTAPSLQPTHGNIRHGFVYERVPHIMLSSIANNAEIDVIWDKWQQTLEPLREHLNAALKKSWQDWEIPREADAKWSDPAKKLHGDWWQARIARQKEIDASIAAKAEFEYLYDKPYENKKAVRVAGPFTVESLSPHRVLGVDENDELIDTLREPEAEYEAKQSFPQMILENLKVAGVQQAHREDRITFTSLVAWPGELVCAEGRYVEGDGVEKRAAVFIGPEFGTVQRADLVEAAREAADAVFDVLIVCAFNFEAHTTDFAKLGKLPVLKARMNADLHMAEDLKNTGKGNLFVIFGEPDITILSEDDTLKVKVNGVDVFKPQTGEVVSDGADGIACWFIDTDYNEESFFVRHAYFLGTAIAYTFIILLNLVRLPDCAGEGRGVQRGRAVFGKHGCGAGGDCSWDRRYRGGAWRE
jgi:adenine-specific DNA-methyltransferase